MVGKRIGAILDAKKEGKKLIVRMFGYGVYKGEEVPPVYVKGFLADIAREVGKKVPVLELDDGQVIYGCECWWRSEKEIKELEKRADEVIWIKIDEVRNQDASGNE